MARDYQIKSTAKGEGTGIDYQAELNEQQFAAVSSPPGPALVIAGAGSGKTRTLTHRVAYLLDKGVDPGNILLLTFTNKAAREMTERVCELVPRDISALWSGTFHSIGNRILRRHSDELGYTRSFSIMDRDDQKSMLNPIIKSLNVSSSSGKRFPKADVILSIFSLAENTCEEISDIIEWSYGHLDEWLGDIETAHTRYRTRKKEANSMDFDDLLTLTRKLLEDNQDLRALYQKKFRHVLVDEYQDTNTVQCALIDLLVGEQQNLMAVGDDAQSIYSWRGADMSNILEFHNKYPQAQVFKIETNYRSVPEVLQLSNAAIMRNKKQFHKELRAVRERGMKPARIQLETPSIQSTFVGERIDELLGEGVDPEEVAVLYRAHYQSMEIQMELTRLGIPFQITSGLRFFEQAHIKDVAAFIRFVVNPRDEVSFKRMALLLPGVGERSADNLWIAWKNSAAGASDTVPESFAQTLLGFRVPPKAKDSWEQLCHILDELIDGDGGYVTPSAMIFSILEGFYEDYMMASFDNHEQRKQDIEQLMQYGEGYTDVLEFLAQLSLMSSTDGDPKNKEKEKNGVILSSIHQAKGLEWNVVFLVSLSEGMFPTTRVIETEDPDTLEEERRLFYVAVTRAKDQLYLTYPMTNPRNYSGDYYLKPSRFLQDIPKDLTEEWNVSVW